MLDDSVNVTSTNRVFGTVQQSVASCEGTEEKFSGFGPRITVKEAGKHTIH